MPPLRYTRMAMLLHWLVALLIGVNILLGYIPDSVPESWSRPVIDLHKSVGITVIGLVILRLLWRAANPPPPMPATYRPLERRAAHWAHYALYAVAILLPLSGWLHDSAWKGAPTHPLTLFGVIPWFRFGVIEHMAPASKEAFHSFMFSVHVAFGYALYALLALHVLGALKHQFYDREPELQRMLPGR